MKKSKIIVVILVLVLIINILLLITLIRKNKTSNISENKNATSSKYIQAKSLNIVNSSNLSVLDIGNLAREDLLNYTNKYITKFLPDMYSQINDNIEFNETYFNRKKATIHRFSNMYKYDDFVQFIDTMKKSGINFNNYSTIEFISSTNNEGKGIIKTIIKYEDGKSITLILNYEYNAITGTSLQI